MNLTSPYAVVIDLDRCIGCWACAIACKMKNDLPEGEWWLRVETVDGEQTATPSDTTPATASETIPGTASDTTPAQRAYYRPVIERCSYSSAQAQRGVLPDCVKACPVGAMRFGDPNQADSRVASDLRSPDATHTGNPPGSAFAVTYVPVRTLRRQRRSGFPPS